MQLRSIAFVGLGGKISQVNQLVCLLFMLLVQVGQILYFNSTKKYFNFIHSNLIEISMIHQIRSFPGCYQRRVVHRQCPITNF